MTDNAVSENPLEIRLFDRDGPQSLRLDDLASVQPGPHQLVWVHASRPDAAALSKIGTHLDVPEAALARLRDLDGAPHVHHVGSCFTVQVVAVQDEDMPQFPGEVLAAFCGSNVVVTVARGAASFLDEIMDGVDANPEVRTLTAEGFLASLLDAHLGSYFQAASHIEAEVERLETRLMARTPRDCLQELRLLRRAISRLRRMLAAHRTVFTAMARPDFRPASEDARMEAHFSRLETQYERAMDVIEHMRELVLGSFDLFSTRVAMGTNDMMQLLTFVTVLFGLLAVAAGVLGMNFEVAFFKTGAVGFWTAIAVMGGVSVGLMWWGKRRGWF